MLKETAISDVIKELGLPKNTKFIGYALHLKDKDEFLVRYVSNEYRDEMWWSKTPENAKKFKQHKKALKIRNELKPEAKIVHVWDIGRQLMITLAE